MTGNQVELRLMQIVQKYAGHTIAAHDVFSSTAFLLRHCRKCKWNTEEHLHQ